jgi:hypothetical protein
MRNSMIEDIVHYMIYRSHIMKNCFRENLLDLSQAKAYFYNMLCSTPYKEYTVPLPDNKQTGSMKDKAFFTGMINMLIEENRGGVPCDYDSRRPSTFIQSGRPLRTLSRRVDGAFPSPINPVAIWEIKEYYYTTTFGSRVAGGLYETLLDGEKLLELKASTGQSVYHVLFIDSYYTWWKDGKSYLMKMVDMLHMGLVDEIIVGREIFIRLPELVV